MSFFPSPLFPQTVTKLNRVLSFSMYAGKGSLYDAGTGRADRESKGQFSGGTLVGRKRFFDFSISRSYYTMFYITEALLLTEGLAFSKHSAVIAAFGQHFAKTGRVSSDFHRYLIEAEGSRNVGDYDINSRLSKDDASLHITRAEEFLKLAEILLKSIPLK